MPAAEPSFVSPIGLAIVELESLNDDDDDDDDDEESVGYSRIIDTATPNGVLSARDAIGTDDAAKIDAAAAAVSRTGRTAVPSRVRPR